MLFRNKLKNNKIFIGLILANLTWSVHPVLAKILVTSHSPVVSAWLRYSSALISYVFIFFFLQFIKKPPFKKLFFKPSHFKEFILVLLLGGFTFFFSPMTQMIGLSYTRAVDNALIIAMEPLMTVCLAWLFLKERLGWVQVVAFLVSLIGFSMLSEMTLERLTHSFSPQLIGNFILLISLVGEAVYSTLGKKLSKKHPPASVFGNALLVGVVLLTLLLVIKDWNAIIHLELSVSQVLAILWLGPVGTCFGYLFWMFAIQKVSVSSAALTLFIQPVAGALWGVLLLKESLSLGQLFGGILIIGSVMSIMLFSEK